MEKETKTITEWAKDSRCPLKKKTLWNAVASGALKACRPSGAKKWLITWNDLESFLSGESNQVG